MDFSWIVLTATDASGAGLGGMMSLIWMAVLLIAFYFILIHPQRKKEKKDAEMRKNISLGDEVIAAGGIVGIVCKLEDNTLVIETGGDRSRIRIARWSVAQNLTAEAEKEAAAKKSMEEKAALAQSAAEEKKRKKGKKSDDEPVEIEKKD